MLNFALNCEAKRYISVSSCLQTAVDASRMTSPVLQSDLLQAPVSFICAEPQLWHYREATHVILHNDSSMSREASRAIAAKLTASSAFQLLLTTAPLPFQTNLLHIGETTLDVKSVRTARQRADAEHSGAQWKGIHTMSRARSMVAAALGSRRVHLYATSFEVVPAGTLAELFCTDGLCCLPQSWQAGALPPLAAHTSAYLDLVAH